MYVTLGSMRVQGRLNAQKGDLIPLWLFVLEAVPRGKQACRSDPRPRSCPADNLSPDPPNCLGVDGVSIREMGPPTWENVVTEATS